MGIGSEMVVSAIARRRVSRRGSDEEAKKNDVVDDERRCFWQLPAEEVRNSESQEKEI